MIPELAKTLIVLGAILIAVGAVLALAGKVPWLGRLPGDIVIEREHVRFYFPLATSILVSLALTVLLWLLRR